MSTLLNIICPGLGHIYQGRYVAGVLWFFFILFGYLMLIVPGFVLHVLCVLHTHPYQFAHPVVVVNKESRQRK